MNFKFWKRARYDAQGRKLPIGAPKDYFGPQPTRTTPVISNESADLYVDPSIYDWSEDESIVEKPSPAVPETFPEAARFDPDVNPMTQYVTPEPYDTGSGYSSSTSYDPPSTSSYGTSTSDYSSSYSSSSDSGSSTSGGE